MVAAAAHPQRKELARYCDLVVTRAARFRCTQEFRNEPFNDTTFTSDWEIPRTHLGTAEAIMGGFGDEFAQPPVGPPTQSYDFSGPLAAPANGVPVLRLDGRDLPTNHPILSTDDFEFGTSANRLDRHGAGVEMGDAVLGVVCAEQRRPPRWAVAYYTAYGQAGSIMSSLATWAIIAGLA